MRDARTVIAAEIFRQYKANPHWDDAKQVVECLNHDAILAALAEAGLVVVPRKPTEKMMQAALRYVDDDTQDALPHGVWQVMIEAANEQ